jgi:hypothetical protein
MQEKIFWMTYVPEAWQLNLETSEWRSGQTSISWKSRFKKGREGDDPRERTDSSESRCDQRGQARGTVLNHDLYDEGGIARFRAGEQLMEDFFDKGEVEKSISVL